MASLKFNLEVGRCVCETLQIFPRFILYPHWGCWANVLAIVSDFFFPRNILNRLKSQVTEKKLCSCFSSPSWNDVPWLTQAVAGRGRSWKCRPDRLRPGLSLLSAGSLSCPAAPQCWCGSLGHLQHSGTEFMSQFCYSAAWFLSLLLCFLIFFLCNHLRKILSIPFLHDSNILTIFISSEDFLMVSIQQRKKAAYVTTPVGFQSAP